MDKIVKRINEIASDRSSGAAILIMKAIDVFELFAERYDNSDSDTFWLDFKRISDLLCHAQPAMAPFISLSLAIERALTEELAKSIGLDAARFAILRAAKTYRIKLLKSKNAICAELINIIEDNDVLITHSNSSTIKDILICVHENKKPFTLMATESRPGFEGKELAKDLGRAGIHCTLITDTSALQHLETAHMVIMGADAVTEQFFINKVGTLTLALGAKEYSKKFYVATDTSKLIPSTKLIFDSYKHPVDEKYPNDTENFEKIPLDLITGIITEIGVLTPLQIEIYIRSRFKV